MSALTFLSPSNDRKSRIKKSTSIETNSEEASITRTAPKVSKKWIRITSEEIKQSAGKSGQFRGAHDALVVLNFTTVTLVHDHFHGSPKSDCKRGSFHGKPSFVSKEYNKI